MIFYKITFGKCDKDKREEAEDLICEYLAALIHNGQIDINYDVVPWQGQMVAYVNALGLRADRHRFHSEWGRKRLKAIQKYFGQTPVWTCNEDDPPKKLATWKNASFLYLATGLLDYCTSLGIGDDGCPLPYFRLPLTDAEKDDIYCWTAEYRELDAIWIGSGDLEMPAYRLLAEPDSSLSSEGRACCAATEKATGVPTYYYLTRYFGRKDSEEKKRRCPGCGGEWFVEQPEGNTQFWHFDFQCKKCRLVSRLACREGDVNLRYAKIGEPRKGKDG